MQSMIVTESPTYIVLRQRLLNEWYTALKHRLTVW